MDTPIQPAGNENGTMHENPDQKTRGILKSLMQSGSNLESGSHSIPIPHTLQDEKRVASNEILFSKTWNIHKTTPFYNFRIDQLETYENELVNYIVANARSISSSILSRNNSNSALVTVSHAFPSQIDGAGHNLIETVDDIGDITAIKFQVLDLDDEDQMDVDGNNAQNDITQNSLLISITIKPKGRTLEQQYYCTIIRDHIIKTHSNSAFAYFNLVLLKAPAVIGQLVTQWLEKRFDTRICRFHFQSFEFRAIVNTSLDAQYNHAQGQEEKKPRPIELHYTFPDNVKGLRNISVSLPPDEARQLLVSRENESEAKFLDGIEAHCTDSLKIDFSRLTLSRAGCSSWFIASEGKVKIFPTISDRYSLKAFIQKISECGI